MWRRNSAPLPACALTPILLPLWCSLPYKGRWRWALPALNRCSNAAVPIDNSDSEGLDELGAKLCQAQVTKHSILNTNHVQKLTSKGTSCKIWPLGSTGTWIIFTLVFYLPFINWLSGEIQNNIIQPLYCSIVKLTFSCFLIISTFILQQWQPIRIQKKKGKEGLQSCLSPEEHSTGFLPTAFYGDSRQQNQPCKNHKWRKEVKIASIIMGT